MGNRWSFPWIVKPMDGWRRIDPARFAPAPAQRCPPPPPHQPVPMRFLLALLAAWTVIAGEPVVLGGPAPRADALPGWAAATGVSWAAGRVSVVDAVARLNASGNPTRLAADVAVGQEAIELPAFSGPYWQAVETICERFHLDLRPAPLLIEDPVHLAWGAAELATAKGPRRWQPAGAVALWWVPGPAGQAEGDLHKLALRLEPRLVESEVGSATCTYADDAGMVTGTLTLSRVESWSATIPITTGNTVPLRFRDQPGELSLLRQGQWSLTVALPEAASVGPPRLRLEREGQPIRIRSAGQDRRTTEGVVQVVRSHRLTDLVEGAYTVRLSADCRLGEAELPFAAKVPKPSAAIGDGSTRATWDAGRRTLGQALAMLLARGPSPAGNPILAELGANVRATADLPAFSGTWWEAVLAVCQAFDLRILPAMPMDSSDDPLPVQVAPVTIGPPRAGLPELDRYHASGALLVERLPSSGTAADRGKLSLRLRLEPGLAEDGLSATVSWNGKAQFGTIPVDLNVTEPDKQPDEQRHRFVRLPGRGGIMVRTPGQADSRNNPVHQLSAELPADPGGLRISGTVRLNGRSTAMAETVVAPDAPGVLHLADPPVLLRLLTPNQALELGLGNARWLLASGVTAEGAELMTGPVDGQLAAVEQRPRPLPASAGKPRQLAWPVPGEGALRVMLQGAVPETGIILPLTVTVDIR